MTASARVCKGAKCEPDGGVVFLGFFKQWVYVSYMNGKWGISTCNVNISCPVLITPSDRVCQQQGRSLWVPFQNAATAVTNLYKGKLRNLSWTVLHYTRLLPNAYFSFYAYARVCVQCVTHSLISVVCAYCTHVGGHTERMYRQIFLNMRTLDTQRAMHLEFFALIKLVQCSVATLWTFHFF